MSPSRADDGNNEEVPPTYEEAVKSSSPLPSGSNTRPTNNQSSHSFNRPHLQPPHQSNSYNNYIPNTSTSSPNINQSPQLPFQYPKHYHCNKCNNTGFKKKNGLSCKDCWDKLAPRNSSKSIKTHYDPQFFGSTTFAYNPPQQIYHNHHQQPIPQGPPIRVPPGDPRLGGVICGRCRGSGMVRFLLDMELCHVCNGLGRVISVRQQPHPQPQYNQPHPQPHYTSYYGDSKR